MGVTDLAVSLNAYEQLGVDLVARLSCHLPAGGTECTAAGPSDVIPPRSFLVLEVRVTQSPIPSGTDVIFSWRAAAP
jgi:hypothetical protein